MTHVDPFAPADHPDHPSQVGGHFTPEAEASAAELLADIQAYEELAPTHLTPAEAEARESGTPDGGAPDLPTLEELRVRVDALVDYLERRGSDDNEPPRIVDAYGVEHILRVNDDGDEAHWEPVALGYDDMKVAELKGLLADRELSVVGNKPDLIARLVEHDAATAAAQEIENAGGDTA